MGGMGLILSGSIPPSIPKFIIFYYKLRHGDSFEKTLAKKEERYNKKVYNDNSKLKKE